MMINPIEDLRLHEEATKGEWASVLDNWNNGFPVVMAESGVVCGFGKIGANSAVQEEKDAILIARAKNILPEYIKECERLQTALNLACDALRNDDKEFGLHVRFDSGSYEDYFIKLAGLEG